MIYDKNSNIIYIQANMNFSDNQSMRETFPNNLIATHFQFVAGIQVQWTS